MLQVADLLEKILWIKEEYNRLEEENRKLKIKLAELEKEEKHNWKEVNRGREW